MNYNNEHRENHHEEKKFQMKINFKCNFCAETFKIKSDVMAHQNKNTLEKLLVVGIIQLANVFIMKYTAGLYIMKLLLVLPKNLNAMFVILSLKQKQN